MIFGSFILVGLGTVTAEVFESPVALPS